MRSIARSVTIHNRVLNSYERLQKISGNDPSLLEKTVYALGLLEAISKVGMPFIFKGGTCLMLLLEKPRRLSTEILLHLHHTLMEYHLVWAKSLKLLSSCMTDKTYRK